MITYLQRRFFMTELNGQLNEPTDCTNIENQEQVNLFRFRTMGYELLVRSS